jgi:hypothetical protein
VDADDPASADHTSGLRRLSGFQRMRSIAVRSMRTY